MKLLPSVVIASAAAMHCEGADERYFLENIPICDPDVLDSCGENQKCSTYGSNGLGEYRCVCRYNKNGVYGNLDEVDSTCEAFCKYPWTRRCLEDEKSVYDICEWDKEDSGDGSGDWGSGSGDGSGEGSGEGSGDPWLDFCDREDEAKCIDKLGELSTCFYDHNDRMRCVCDEETYYSKQDEACVALVDECAEDADCDDSKICEEVEFKGMNMNKCVCTEGFGESRSTGACEPLCGWEDASTTTEAPGTTTEAPGTTLGPPTVGKWKKKKNRGRRSSGKGNGNDKKYDGEIDAADYEVCDENATCVTEGVEFPECVCNDGFYGNGEKCEDIGESCDQKCIDRYSEFHQCLVATDGNQFSCECIDGYVRGSDPRTCVPAPLDCTTSEDCFGPYLNYNLTEIEAAERVMCVGNQDGITSSCGCTLDFPYVDEEGLCVDEREDPEDPEIETCETKKCREGAICVEETGEPECVCDEANGYIGNGGRCWQDTGVDLCGTDSYGTCGNKNANFPVRFGHTCASDIDAVNVVDFNTICMQAEEDNRRDGCCKCAPGWTDANGDPNDGCEEEALGCDYNADFCDENATCEDLDPDTDPETTDLDPTFIEKGFICRCNDGFFGKGYGKKGCRERVGGGVNYCEKWGDKCGPNSVCSELETRPFIRCDCAEGFEGQPPNCQALGPALSVAENGCDQLDSSSWYQLTSKKPDDKLSAVGSDTSYSVDITSGSYMWKTPLLNGKPYSALLEFGSISCGPEFMKAFATGQMTARVEDTVAYQDRHGNPIADLYEVVDVSGFYVKEGDKDSKSKAYVQFNKNFGTLGEHMNYTSNELADFKNKKLNLLETNQQWKSRNGWAYVTPFADTIKLSLKSDLPVFAGMDVAKCFTPDKIRFFVYADKLENNKLEPKLYKNEEDKAVSIVDCFYQNKMNFEDVQCLNTKIECEYDMTLEEETCSDVNQTLYEALFEPTDEINDKICLY